MLMKRCCYSVNKPKTGFISTSSRHGIRELPGRKLTTLQKKSFTHFCALNHGSKVLASNNSNLA